VTDPDLYKVLGNGPETEIKIKGSRFLGQAFHAPDLETGRRRLETVRKKYHGATHHCWAARVGEPGRVEERSDDDGEPSGTAGAPILAVLRGGEFHDGLVVVTRYFGGVKLGTGGLGRAYSEAARAALDRAPVVSGQQAVILAVEVGWDDLGSLETVLARSARDLFQVERDFGERPRLSLSVRRSLAAGFRETLLEALAGRIHFPEL